MLGIVYVPPSLSGCCNIFPNSVSVHLDAGSNNMIAATDIFRYLVAAKRTLSIEFLR